jgi:Fe-S-cluster containining protein
VHLSAREPIVRLHPELVVREGRRIELLRTGERCAALDGGHAPDEPYVCRVYDDRPRTCRDFAAGGEHCLTARRRVGLSR